MLSILSSKMRSVLAILCISLISIGSLFFIPGPIHADGNIYYVATNGVDTNDGSLNMPFRTIQHCAMIASTGTTCLIRQGTYHETVTPSNSGTPSNPITFQSYQGEQVTVDGADAVTDWSPYQGNIYQANVSIDPSLFANQVFVDGQMMNEARWPNSGLDQLTPALSVAEHGSGAPHLYDAHLTQADNFWSGATIHYWGNNAYGSQTGTVTASAPGNLTFNGANRACPYLCLSDGDKYYLSGVLNALDSPSEWVYDSSAHKLYLWTSAGDAPTNHVVEIKQRNYAFDLSNKSYVTIRGLSLFGNTITTSTSSSYDVIDTITAMYLSHFTLVDDPDNTDFGFLQSHTADTGIILNGTNNTLSNSRLGISAGNGVALHGSYNTVTNTVIHDTDYMGTYAASINASGDHLQITHNTIYRTGRDAITGGGSTFQYNQISYNDIFNTSMLNRDSGSIYLCCGTNGTGTSIDHNTIHDSQVPRFQRYDFNAAGIYLDNGVSSLLVHHNVLWNDANVGILLNSDAGNNEFSMNNHLYNNTFVGGQGRDIDCCVSGSSGNEAKNNLFTAGVNLNNGVTAATNLPSTTDPLFVNPQKFDAHLQSSSPAIDAGTVIPGITDGYVGSAPDLGAYEHGGSDWIAGSSLCRGVLPAPSITSVTNSSGQIVVTWTAVKHATGYKVHYGTASEQYTQTFDAANTLTSSLTVSAGQCYFIAVNSYNSSGASANSAEVSHSAPGGTRNAQQVIYADSYDQKTANTSDQIIAVYLGASGPGDYLEYDNVDFGSGVNEFTINIGVDDHFAHQPLEIHLDSPTGTLVGSIIIQGTGNDYYNSWRSFTYQKTLITSTSGVHNLFLVEQAGNGTTVGFMRSFFFSQITQHDAFAQISALSFDSKNGNEQAVFDGTSLGHLDGGTWIEYSNLNFGTGAGAGQFSASVAVPAANAGRTIELHIDSATGSLIGTLVVQPTGDYATFATQTAYVTPTTGLHDLYLVVTGNLQGTANMSWFSFSPPITPLSRAGWTATASVGNASVSNILDGAYQTRWTSGAVQSAGMSIQVDMQSPQTFNKIILDANQSASDYPRGYEVYVSNDGSNFGSAVATGNGSSATIITFPIQTARYIKIVQTQSGVTGQWWSLHEFLVYAPSVSALSQIQAKNYSAITGDIKLDCGGTCLGSLDSGSWARYSNLDFGSGVSTFTANLAVYNDYAGQKIELRLDSPTGTLIGTIVPQGTGDWYTFTQQSTTINTVSGFHDFYLVIPRGEYGAANVNWMQFS